MKPHWSKGSGFRSVALAATRSGLLFSAKWKVKRVPSPQPISWKNTRSKRATLLLIRLLAIGIATEAGKALHLQFASITGMARPTILVAETEPTQALSVRKLVLESAKYNVLTAHSTDEALDIFQMFPNVNVAVLVMDGGIDCELVARSIKQVTTKIPIVATSSRIAQKCENADHMLSSHEPETLVKLMRALVGDPR
jgi:CheY-like chemotaxis protein